MWCHHGRGDSRSHERRGFSCQDASAVLAAHWFDDVKRLSLVVDEHVPDDSRAEQEHHFQPFVILDLNAVEIRLHDRQLLQHCEESDSDVRLFAFFRLLP